MHYFLHLSFFSFFQKKELHALEKKTHTNEIICSFFYFYVKYQLYKVSLYGCPYKMYNKFYNSQTEKFIF